MWTLPQSVPCRSLSHLPKVGLFSVDAVKGVEVRVEQYFSSSVNCDQIILEDVNGKHTPETLLADTPTNIYCSIMAFYQAATRLELHY